MTYGPLWFTPDPNSDYIPACPTRVTSPDVNRRDNILTPGMTIEQWHAKKTRWSFSHSTGTLESPYMLPGFELAREVNRILAVAEDNEGRRSVKKIILWIAHEHLDECYDQLVVNGYSRAGHLETSAPQFAFVCVKPKRWKE